MKKKAFVWLLTLVMMASLIPMTTLAQARINDRDDRYEITFRGNGGDPATTRRLVRPGSTVVGSAPNVSREGFDFIGWWDESRDGNRVNNDRVSDGMTVYAQWERIPWEERERDRDITASAGATQPAPAPALPAAPAPTAVTAANMQNLTQDAIRAAAPNTTPSVRLTDPGLASQSALRAAVNAAQGRTIAINADSLTAGNSVDVRIRFDPALATRDMNLAASTTSQSAIQTRNVFQGHFGGTMSVVSLGQQGDFGMEVRIAARVDTSLNANNLFFYAYDPVNNRFQRFTPTGDTTLDNNGYLHFNTTLAGDIVISNTQI
ncbi:MAG: InlB B-repeat-containing protein [Oscillospiraceae bacterium]|nr:InlB B-repeat-containing protein [Oscillospiraceae bacterium]